MNLTRRDLAIGIALGLFAGALTIILSLAGSAILWDAWQSRSKLPPPSAREVVQPPNDITFDPAKRYDLTLKSDQTELVLRNVRVLGSPLDSRDKQAALQLEAAFGGSFAVDCAVVELPDGRHSYIRDYNVLVATETEPAEP